MPALLGADYGQNLEGENAAEIAELSKRTRGSRWPVAGGVRAGNLSERKRRAGIAELSERTQFAPAARSVEDINTIWVASFGSRSVRLTKVARSRRGRQAGTGGGIHLEEELAKGLSGFLARPSSGPTNLALEVPDANLMFPWHDSGWRIRLLRGVFPWLIEIDEKNYNFLKLL
jgi:hypothetical protein